MMTATLDSQERFHPRVGAGFMVKLLINGRALVCKARDLSMAGLYISNAPSSLEEKVTVAVPLPGDREVVTSCLVRRVQEDGVGLEFEHLDWDDMFALARFLHPRLP
ncbi:MAG: PilZ domain-containing protein [Myxococcaceae bacterium]